VAAKRPALRQITREPFRSNPNYSLVLADRVPADVRTRLEAADDDVLYGFLLPRDGTGLAPRSVDQDVALLFFTLQEPGPLPAYVATTLGDDCNRVVAELVLDGVLELATGGAFVSGAAAHELIFTCSPRGVGDGMIARLSREALRYAQLLRLGDSRLLSTRLYLYNHLPLTPAFRRHLESLGGTPGFLRLGSGGRRDEFIGKSWKRMTPEVKNGWLAWARSVPRAQAADPQPLYKLYVSPHPEDTPEVLVESAAALATSDAVSFKVGADMHGLLRPDKIVAYFPSLDSLQETASRLEARLAACEAHGVPFTAEAGGGGLLSWGVDPAGRRDGGSLLSESWRLWVTNRLAVAFVAAHAAADADVEPSTFAIDRLRLEGVDTDTWTPSQSMFLAR
jgi:hypothetical protein